MSVIYLVQAANGGQTGEDGGEARRVAPGQVVVVGVEEVVSSTAAQREHLLREADLRSMGNVTSP